MRDFSIDILWAKIQVAFTAIGGWIGWFLGGADGMLMALLLLMALDYISGVMCAIEDKTLSSAIGFKGIAKKVLILMLVGVANILDVNVVGGGAILRGAVICFYLSNEGLSLLENAAYLGLPVPEKLKEVLSQLHHRDEKEGTADTGKVDTTGQTTPTETVDRHTTDQGEGE